MIPTTSSIDSGIVDLGDLTTNYGITQSAIPLDVGDSSGSVPTFNAGYAITHEDSVHAIGQQLTLTTDDEGRFVGKVVGVGTPAANVMNLSADTFFSNLTVEKRTYPIYRSLGIGTHIVSAAVDHWTQEAGLFYDVVPGRVAAYHSCYGHDYIYGTDTAAKPRVQMLASAGVPNMRYRLANDRVVMELTRNASGSFSTSSVDPAHSIPTPIPTAGSGDALVFSVGLVVSGIQSGSMTWNLRTHGTGHAASKPVVVRLVWGKTSGISAQITNSNGVLSILTYTTALAEGNYRASIALSEFDSTHTTMRLRVVAEDTGTVRDFSGAVLTPLRGSQVQLGTANIVANATGSGTPWGMYGYFVSTMPLSELPTVRLPVRKSLGQTRNNVSIVPGFTGDVWNNIKTLLSLHRMDLWYEDDQLRTGLRQTALRIIPEISRPSINVNLRDEAKFIEVVNHRMTAHSGVPTVLHKSDSVHQVATGEVETITVQTEHSIDTVGDPVCVSGITPYPYKSGPGQYVITGSDGYIVSPAWWKDNGGKITARTTDTEGEIEITIKGPDYDSVRSPYRVSEGDAGRPALYITGTGILGDPITLKIPTGNPTAVEDIGETVDIPFITGELLAYDAAAQVSQKYAAPDVALGITEAKLAGTQGALSRRGAGALIQYKGNVYRVGTVAHGRATNQATNATPHNTIGAVIDGVGTRTIAQANNAHGDRTIKDVALRPLLSTPKPIAPITPWNNGNG